MWNLFKVEIFVDSSKIEKQHESLIRSSQVEQNQEAASELQACLDEVESDLESCIEELQELAACISEQSSNLQVALTSILSLNPFQTSGDTNQIENASDKASKGAGQG